jgi:hypothetical protein
MAWLRRSLMFMAIAGLVLSSAPTAYSQQPPAPKAPAQKSSAAMAPVQKSSTQAAPAPQPNQRVVVVEPIRVFDPFYDYPYPYAYPPDYMSANFGYVKIKTDRKDASVYVDGGFADRVEKAKKFALRPGTHDIELRDSDGRTLFRERIAVIVDKTTELHVS